MPTYSYKLEIIGVGPISVQVTLANQPIPMVSNNGKKWKPADTPVNLSFNGNLTGTILITAASGTGWTVKITNQGNVVFNSSGETENNGSHVTINTTPI
ncbi:hypothetical protein [Ekhidna sp.]|uniref:hypothetical protein n=1 Tax=Ekhidna sp. TaxID=2608089 RepID=UPI003B50F2F2